MSLIVFWKFSFYIIQIYNHFINYVGVFFYGVSELIHTGRHFSQIHDQWSRKSKEGDSPTLDHQGDIETKEECDWQC